MYMYYASLLKPVVVGRIAYRYIFHVMLLCVCLGIPSVNEMECTVCIVRNWVRLFS